MHELLISTYSIKWSGTTVDGNVDAALASASDAMVVGNNQTVSLSGATPTATAAVVFGYWNGKLYVLKSDGLHMFDVKTMSYLGTVSGVAGRTIPLNGASFLRNGVIYFGQGRGKTGVIESLNLATGAYKSYPALAYNYGAIYVDDKYIYSIANVYTSTGFSTNAIRRCLIGGTAWEDVVLSGAFTHGVSGGDATLVDGLVYITGGGAIVNSSDQDGSAYTDVQRVDLVNRKISQIQVPSPGFVNWDMASCIWKGIIYALTAQATTINKYDVVKGTASTVNSVTTQYHCPCLRVGDLFFYLPRYDSLNIVKYKLSGGL